MRRWAPYLQLGVSALLTASALPLVADTIVLKNGRRITATQVTEENGRVSYETPAGWLSLSKLVVDRIERGGPAWTSSRSSPDASIGVPSAPPSVETLGGYDHIARAAVHDGGIDRNYLLSLEDAAKNGEPQAATRVAAARHAAAQFELARGDTEQAIAHYRSALIFAPGQPNLLLHIAYLHLRRGEYSPALDYLDRANRVVPDSPDVAKLTGWAHYGLNRIDQAVEDWKRAQRLRSDPEIARALEKALRDKQEEGSYREGESRHFRLRYNGSAAPALARDVLRTLEEHFRAIESELNFTPSEPIGVILYTQEAFADITRAPGWVGALNDGRIRVPVQGLTSVPAELSRVLKHELTHSFIQQKTRGRCPVWLNEGIAQWMEGQRSRDYAEVLVAAYERKSHAPLAALEGSWMNLPAPVARYAYAWALSVVEYVVSADGMRDVERLLDRLATEASPEEAARSVLHMNYADLEEAAAKYLRHTYLR